MNARRESASVTWTQTCDMSKLEYPMPEPSPASPKRRWLRPVLFALAVVFAAATILYTTLWMLAKRPAPEVDLGFDHSPFLVVTHVQQASPAEKAGLRPGDRILAVNGTRLKGANSLFLQRKRCCTTTPHNVTTDPTDLLANQAHASVLLAASEAWRDLALLTVRGNGVFGEGEMRHIGRR